MSKMVIKSNDFKAYPIDKKVGISTTL